MFERQSIACLTVAIVGVLPAMLFVPKTGWAQIEEIIVTTRKKEESLQDVPLAVDAFTEQQIQRQGITSVKDVAKFSPSVQFDTSYNPTDTRVNVRGLSATRGRSNVAFLIDGIDVTTENVIAAGSGLLANARLLNDIERIEVVKGPQSALYGRAAFAGAISYITKEPGDEFEGDFRLDTAEDGYLEAAAALGGPVIDGLLGLRANGVYWTDDGRYLNSVSGAQLGGGDGFGTSLTAVLTPTDRLKFKARVEYSDDHFDQAPTTTLIQDTPVVYPESAYLVGLTGGTSRDLVLSDAGNATPGEGASTESTATVALRDHGLYCNDVLPEGLSRDERQLALKQIYPDYPEVTDQWITDNFPGVGPADLPLSLLPLSDGSAPLVPGYCLPSTFGSSNGKVAALGEDAATGGEYEGTNVETFRASLLTTLDYEYGGYSLNMGYTDSDSSIHLDQDYQTINRPDESFTQQTANSTTQTEQTSVELRFASDWEGSPVQLTLGGLYWNEERNIIDQNFIIACLDRSRNGNNIDGAVTGICDGLDSNDFGATLDNWQDYRAQLEPAPGGLWETETDHKSAYFMVEWDIADHWNLAFEDRYVDESFDLSKPNFSSCSNLAFTIAGGAIAQIAPMLDESDPANQVGPNGFDARCTQDQFDSSNGPVWWSSLDQSVKDLYEAPKNGSDVLLPGTPFIAEDGDPAFNADCTPLGVDPNCVPYGNIVGTESSSYHTPKVTLQWMPSDDSMLYLSWGKGRKPAGINAVSSGGAATTIDEERFDSEKMENWEFGWKTAWELGGALQFNGALFFQDYTDKQIGTQILISDGIGGFRSNPRVINASSAEVWGLELEAIWQPNFLDGLVLSGGYTFLDTQYTDFVDETTTFIRAGAVGACDVVWKDGEETIATGTADPNLDPVLYPVADRTFDPVSGDLNTIYAPKCALDLSGNQLERAPENAFVGNVSLTRPFMSSGLDWFTSVNAIYQDERMRNPDNFIKWDDYWLFDFQLGLASENIEVLLYVDNVFDDDTLKSGGSGSILVTDADPTGEAV